MVPFSNTQKGWQHFFHPGGGGVPNCSHQRLETFHLVSSFYPEGLWWEGTAALLEHISELEKVLPPQLPHEPQEAALSCFL